MVLGYVIISAKYNCHVKKSEGGENLIKEVCLLLIIVMLVSGEILYSKQRIHL